MKSKIVEVIKSTVNLVGIYSAGVAISTTFVLTTNDMFYNTVFRQLLNSTPESRDIMWQEIKPREIFNTGAKKAFVINRIDEEKDDEQQRYHSYIEKRRRLAKEEVQEDEKIYENIFDKNKKI